MLSAASRHGSCAWSAAASRDRFWRQLVAAEVGGSRCVAAPLDAAGADVKLRMSTGSNAGDVNAYMVDVGVKGGADIAKPASGEASCHKGKRPCSF
jgi:hypothetical protein